MIRLSIVVATKDRYETLFNCVEGLLLNYDNEEVEIIVRDNSLSPQIREFQSRFKENTNVVYIHDLTPVSQSENYELAVALARGNFITMIGDDDGIAGGLIDVLDWMEQHAIDAFLPGYSVYLWPGVHFRLQGERGGGLLELEQWSMPKIIDAEAQRRAVLSDGCTSLGELPRLYYGVVNRVCIEKVRKQAGQFFPGPSPDMANAFSLSYTVSRTAMGRLPIFISGNSRKSNAGLGLRGKHVGEIQDLPFLPRDTAERWNPHIPFFWSGQTIWCQSAYSAAERMGNASEFASLNNYRKLYATILVWHPRYAAQLWAAFLSRYDAHGNIMKLLEAIAVVLLACGIWLTRVGKFLSRRFGPNGRRATRLVTGNVDDVMAATRRVDEAMKSTALRAWLEGSIIGKLA